MLGLYRVRDGKGGEVLEWAPDFPTEAAGGAVAVWYAGGDDPNSRSGGGRRRKRPAFPQDFLAKLDVVRDWSPMIKRVLSETR